MAYIGASEDKDVEQEAKVRKHLAAQVQGADGRQGGRHGAGDRSDEGANGLHDVRCPVSRVLNVSRMSRRCLQTTKTEEDRLR
jgi:hypothetical protein